MIEHTRSLPTHWDLEADVVVAGFGAAGFFRHATSNPLRAVAAYEPGEGGKIV
jgi:hypothetical protein